jgi:hypothetical protein
MDRTILIGLLRAAGLAETLADDLIQRGISDDNAAAMIAGAAIALGGPVQRSQGLPVLVGQARFLPQTLNQQTRTVTLCWTTGARGLRYDWESGRFYEEELEVSSRAVRLDRLNNGAPLLDTHQAYELRNQIGVSEKAWISGAEGLADVRFSKRADVEPFYQDVVDGIIRNNSVRYIIHKYEIIRQDGKLDIWRAVDWEPVEISLVPVPFDAGAQVRSGGGPHPATVPANPGQPSNMEITMDRTILLAKLRAAGLAETLADVLIARGISEATADAAIAEEKRKADAARANQPPADPPPADPAPAATTVTAKPAKASEIRSMARTAKLSETEALDLVERAEKDSLTVDQVRAAIFDRMAAGNGAVQQTSVQLIADEVDKRREIVANAIVHRVMPKVQLLNGAGDYRYMRLIDIGVALLRARGESVANMPAARLAARVLTSSDFPYILADVAHKTLRAGYESEPRTFVPWCVKGTLPDFKTVSRVQLGDAPDLKKVLEAGKISEGSFGEAREQYRLYTYARMLRFSREMLINDDLNAFTRIAQMFGNAGARLEGDVVWEQLTSNPTMGDNVTLFSTTTRNNYTAASSLITEDTLNTMEIGMGTQTTIDGNQMNLTPRFLLVPKSRKVAAKKAVAAVTPSKTEEVNPFAGDYEIIVESRLDAAGSNIWYGAADPARIDTIEYAYLDGMEGMSVESQPAAFDSLGIDIRAIHDFGAKAMDGRGLYKNGG